MFKNELKELKEAARSLFQEAEYASNKLHELEDSLVALRCFIPYEHELKLKDSIKIAFLSWESTDGKKKKYRIYLKETKSDGEIVKMALGQTTMETKAKYSEYLSQFMTGYKEHLAALKEHLVTFSESEK